MQLASPGGLGRREGQGVKTCNGPRRFASSAACTCSASGDRPSVCTASAVQSLSWFHEASLPQGVAVRPSGIPTLWCLQEVVCRRVRLAGVVGLIVLDRHLGGG